MSIYLTYTLVPIMILLLDKFIKKHGSEIYVLVAAIAVFSYFKYVPFLNDLFIQGHLGYLLFILVAFAGVIPPTYIVGRKLRVLRKELSILGYIALIPHFYSYLDLALNNYVALELLGLASAIVMLPLFITSFIKIRIKLGTKNWNYLHKLAYPSYLLMMLHLTFVDDTNAVLYYLIIMTYLMLRLVLILKQEKLYSYLYRGLALTGVFGLGFLFSLNLATNNSSLVPTNIIANQDTKQITSTLDTKPSVSTTLLLSGTYSGRGQSIGDSTIVLNVTFEANKITAIEVVDCGCTPNTAIAEYINTTTTQMIDSIISNNTNNVDSVAGATYTSNAVKIAVKDAYQKAFKAASLTASNLTDNTPSNTLPEIGTVDPIIPSQANPAKTTNTNITTNTDATSGSTYNPAKTTTNNTNNYSTDAVSGSTVNYEDDDDDIIENFLKNLFGHNEDDDDDDYDATSGSTTSSYDYEGHDDDDDDH